MSFIVPEHRRKVQPGDRFGMLTVMGVPFYAACGQQLVPHVVCECECGQVTAIEQSRLPPSKRSTTSCGCFRRIANRTHGMSKSRLYKIWAGVKKRCLNDKASRYAYYGGRGITICDEWMEFDGFCSWALSSGYSSDLELDRIDNGGPYKPSNCRWSTRRDQVNNRRNTVMLLAFGELKSLSDWSRDSRCVVSYDQLHARLNTFGYSAEDAISLPKNYRRKPHEKARHFSNPNGFQAPASNRATT